MIGAEIFASARVLGSVVTLHAETNHGVRWTEILLGFGLGLIGGLALDWARDVRTRRLRAALSIEISRIRYQAVAVAWENAISNRSVTA